MLLLVGLGNPGKQFDHTRHNIGFDVIDNVAQSREVSFTCAGDHGVTAQLKILDTPLLLLKPMTFMNNSGVFVRAISKYSGTKSREILVFHDELNISIGKIRMRRAADSSHNGLKSIDNHIGKDYYRLGIGIDRPEDKEDVPSYVLKKFTKGEREKIDIIISVISQNIEIFISNPDNFFEKTQKEIKSMLLNK